MYLCIWCPNGQFMRNVSVRFRVHTLLELQVEHTWTHTQMQVLTCMQTHRHADTHMNANVYTHTDGYCTHLNHAQSQIIVECQPHIITLFSVTSPSHISRALASRVSSLQWSVTTEWCGGLLAPQSQTRAHTSGLLGTWPQLTRMSTFLPAVVPFVSTCNQRTPSHPERRRHAWM